MQFDNYYRNDPETARKSVHYYDDPKSQISSSSLNAFISNFLALLLIICGGTFLQFTYAANVNLSSSSYKEFGQGVINAGSCTGTSSLVISPQTTFVNASGAGAFKVSGVRVDGIPLACQGVKFSISAYGDTSTVPVALYNTNATVIEVDYYSDGTFGVDLSAGLTIVKNSASSFTVTFTNPVALATSTFKFTIQSSKNQTLGVKWSSFSIPGFTDPVSGGAFGNGRYVFAGGWGTLLTSTNGVTWTQTAVPEVGVPWDAVAYGNGKFVLVSQDGDILTTSNGVNYSITRFMTTSFLSVTYGNGKFVAVGGDWQPGDPNFYTSSDGISWTGISNPSAAWSSIIFSNGSFYAAGRGQSLIMTSTDGLNWSSISTNLPSDEWSSIAQTNGIFAISSVSPFVLVGEEYKSSDGSSWSLSTQPGRTDIMLAGSSGIFVGVGKENKYLATSPWIIYSSTDGDKWSERSSIQGNNNVFVFFANKEFYIVADSGEILVSR